MSRLALRRHAMPLSTALAFALAAILSGGLRTGRGAFALGLALIGLHWLAEWRGIAGAFEGRVPRQPLVGLCRAVWLAGLAVAVVDAFGARWTPWQGPGVRAAGVALALAGIALRLWSMRALAGSFSYDLKVVEGQELVRRGPYRWLRHPAYAGMLLWSAALGLWNPSAPGLALLLLGTIPQIALRIRAEERLLEDHFGEAWRAHARATARVIPLVW